MSCALQYVLGGISKLGGISSHQLLTKVEGIENGLLRASASLGIKGLSEVTEEELQLVLESLYRSIVFGEAYDAPTIEEYVYTAASKRVVPNETVLRLMPLRCYSNCAAYSL